MIMIIIIIIIIIIFNNNNNNSYNIYSIVYKYMSIYLVPPSKAYATERV
jgi:hypothetical protein